jgi:hypothetical protein
MQENDGIQVLIFMVLGLTMPAVSQLLHQSR